MTRRTFVLGLGLVFILAAGLRLVWLRADPPPTAAVGIVWHDEGAWTHNARNRALWGTWRTDDWNPVFVAPVFTALEYGAFRAFGVGTWQARTVPVASGLFAIACLVAGMTTLTGRREALAAGLLLATNYVFVMWNRTALMETTMTACLAAAWAASALAERRAGWGAVAGVFATLAWFTKAAAAFFVAAVVLNAMLTLSPWGRDAVAAGRRRAATWTLAGLLVAAVAIVALFVVPHWSEYRFYNWQMSVTRKPEYSLRAFLDRASWLPLAHDVFSRSWLLVVGGFAGLFSVVIRWPAARPAERLLVLWIVIGLAELVVHDSGNARRYIMFLPAFAALTALALAEDPRAARDGAPLLDRRLWVVLPMLAIAAYIVSGSLVRPALQRLVESGDYRLAVRLSAIAAVVVTGIAFLRRASLAHWLTPASRRASGTVLVTVVTLAATWDLKEFAAFARTHAARNYEASVAVGRVLPPGTLVQGKLANGLALENAIRPIFIGNGFGNYADRLHRDDVRFVLTYDLPRLGYESSDGSGLIAGVLARYPNRAVIATFEVDETPLTDRAVLVDKFGDGAPPIGPR